MPVGNPKTITSMQLFRVGGEDGIRQPIGTTTFAVNEGIDPLADNQGRLFVRLADANGVLEANEFFHSNGYVETYNQQFTAINLGFLYLNLIYGFNINAATRFLLLYRNLGAPNPPVPAANSQPDISILVPTNASFSLTPNTLGGELMAFDPGLNPGFWIVSSTTGDLYTPSGTQDFWLNTVIRQQ